jgi:hypothetical protein
MQKKIGPLENQRNRIVSNAVKKLKSTSIFSGKGQPAEELAVIVCEGLVDLMLDPERDDKTLKAFMEWVFNLIRKEGKKTDQTFKFLGILESEVTRTGSEESTDIIEFFDKCREIVERKSVQIIEKT